MKNLEAINFDVYNTLNLLDPVLGECYITEGYNPFGEDYRIKKDVVLKLIDNLNREEIEVNIDFLNYDNSVVIKHFKTSIKKCSELQSLVEQDIEKTEDTKTRQKISDGILYLKNRQKMLEVFCKDLKNPNINSIETFKKLARLNKKYSRLLEESFYEKTKTEMIHQNFMVLCLSKDQIKENAVKGLDAFEKARNPENKSILKQKELENVQQKEAEAEKQAEEKRMEEMRKFVEEKEKLKNAQISADKMKNESHETIQNNSTQKEDSFDK